jgi:hypothetical protein
MMCGPSVEPAARRHRFVAAPDPVDVGVVDNGVLVCGPALRDGHAVERPVREATVDLIKQRKQFRVSAGKSIA